MTQVAISWNLPTQRADNTALAPAEIALTRFSLSFNGGAFVPLIDVPAPAATTNYTTPLTPGSYVLRSVVVDKQTPPKVSAPTDTPFTIPVPALAAPKPVTAQTAVVS